MRLLIILIILSQATLWAKPQTLLECLGKEEEKIHREKLSRQALVFNQNLISDLVGLKNLKLQKRYFNQICSSSRKLDSFKFLEVFLKNKGRIFLSLGDNAQRASNSALLKNFYQKVLTRMNEYISITQMSSPTPDCLFGGETATADFVLKMFYQRDFVSAKQMLHKKNLGLRVLKELREFPSKIKNCPIPKKKSQHPSV